MRDANISGKPVIVLDFDGVIVKSHVVKREAMLALFADYPDKSNAINAYISRSGGVARREKLAAILETVIGVEATPARLAQYLARYAQSLDASLTVVPLVDGIKAFISRRTHSFYISSTAPEAEIHDQLVRSSLLHCFIDVYGCHTPKAKALTEISVRHASEEIVFFGDSLGDLVAAKEAGAAFVGVTNERDNFKNLEIVKLRSFDSGDQVEHSMRTALVNRQRVEFR